MTVSKRNGGFQANFMFKGSRYRKQFASLLEAETWEANAQIALKHGTALPTAGVTVAKGLAKLQTLGGLYDHVCATMWKGAKSERDLLRNGRYAVEHFGRDRLASEITKFDVDCWVAELKKTLNSGGTINRKLAALSKLMTVAVDNKVMPSKPKMDRQREAEGRLRWLEVKEEQAIVHTLRLWSDDLEASLTEFLADTGLRVGEALDMVWSWDRGHYLEVVGAPDRRQNTRGTKSSRSRHVPLTPRARGVLDDLRQTEAQGPFRALTYPSFQFKFGKAVQHVGLDGDGVCIHTLRHTTASRLVMKGVDLNRVRMFLGHSNVKTTMIYSHLAPNSLDSMADVLGSYAENAVDFIRRDSADRLRHPKSVQQQNHERMAANVLKRKKA